MRLGWWYLKDAFNVPLIATWIEFKAWIPTASTSTYIQPQTIPVITSLIPHTNQIIDSLPMADCLLPADSPRFARTCLRQGK
jgi:hypothetical protein